MRRGYSLVEVVVAVFILAGIALASFSVLEAGSRQSLKAQNRISAALLAGQLVEELHAMYSSDIESIPFTPFSPPYEKYEYLYNVESAGYTALPDLQKITVTVQGPLDDSGNLSVQSAVVSYSMLMARQAYSP